MSEFSVRRLGVEDAAALVSLRREALETDPLAFGASLEDDRGLSLEFVRRALADESEHAVFGAFETGRLTGMVGLARPSQLKQRHTAIIWGMYVTPRGRRHGIGRALLDAAIHQGRQWGLIKLQLSVMETAVAAKRMYEAAGFRSWGREPLATAWRGRFVEEDHMALVLRAPDRSPGAG